MKKAASIGFGALLLAAVVCAMAYKQNKVAQLRSEHETLLDESKEAQRLAGENGQISKLRAEDEEVVKLRQENKDLPRLRNEVTQLRRDSEELEKLRAENAALSAKISAGRNAAGSASSELPPDFVTRSALADVGFGSPEAAAETFFWAMCQGNIARLQDASTDGGVGRNANPERERNQLIEQMKDFPGFRIADTNIIPPDEVELHIQASVDGARVPVKLKKVGNDWKIVTN